MLEQRKRRFFLRVSIRSGVLWSQLHSRYKWKYRDVAVLLRKIAYDWGMWGHRQTLRGPTILLGRLKKLCLPCQEMSEEIWSLSQLVRLQDSIYLEVASKDLENLGQAKPSRIWSYRKLFFIVQSSLESTKIQAWVLQTSTYAVSRRKETSKQNLP